MMDPGALGRSSLERDPVTSSISGSRAWKTCLENTMALWPTFYGIDAEAVAPSVFDCPKLTTVPTLRWRLIAVSPAVSFDRAFSRCPPTRHFSLPRSPRQNGSVVECALTERLMSAQLILGCKENVAGYRAPETPRRDFLGWPGPGPAIGSGPNGEGATATFSSPHGLASGGGPSEVSLTASRPLAVLDRWLIGWHQDGLVEGRWNMHHASTALVFRPRHVGPQKKAGGDGSSHSPTIRGGEQRPDDAF
ncbi:hypothetical protein CMUS01_15025 [Colletotrichum musicola]|uniref:Uncharacterized protein n=1 Tax=Colletotrichum musicola TaxID=2175873 RepID=A0A8H6IZC8_9PEZI|nr:hypothetical protein CMUS01_15025 [Colletotrichum musicola]